jgi:hypothetical protein
MSMPVSIGCPVTRQVVKTFGMTLRALSWRADTRAFSELAESEGDSLAGQIVIHREGW